MTREDIKKRIKACPGTHPSDIAADMGIPYTTILYQVQQMAIRGEIEIKTVKNRLRLYPKAKQ
jgi:predicted transcriptional regulator